MSINTHAARGIMACMRNADREADRRTGDPSEEVSECPHSDGCEHLWRGGCREVRREHHMEVSDAIQLLADTSERS